MLYHVRALSVMLCNVASVSVDVLSSMCDAFSVLVIFSINDFQDLGCDMHLNWEKIY